MSKLGIFGATCLAIVILIDDASAQRRGGAVSGGMRGAVVGGMVGGEEGAEKGAKIGAVTGATSAAINREAQARNAYTSTTDYQNASHANFEEAPPEVLGTSATGTAAAPKGEAVINKDGKPVVGITFPADWKQKTGDNYISAVSADGQAYGMLVMLKDVADKQAGIDKAKKAMENYLTDIKFDEPSETKGGAKVITGTGKAKKAGVDVVFATGFFESGKGQLVGATFVVDSKIEDHYKETIKGICQTIRRADDFGK